MHNYMNYKINSTTKKVNWEYYLNIYRKNRNFNPKNFTDKKIIKFNDYLGKNKLSGAVLSVSGGVDSAVTLVLLKKIFELKNSNLKKIMAINQPIKSSNWALERAKELCDKFDIKLTIVDQSKIFEKIENIVYESTKIFPNKFSSGQMKSYIRTPINYYCSQLLSQEGYPSLVVGTGNMDEDGYLAYFCKAGDGVVDIQLISDLHKSEVFLLGEYLKIPESILNAKPSADLWDGQDDESELGFSYDFIEFFTGFFLNLSEENKKKILENLTDISKNEFINYKKKCTEIHNRNKHKLQGVINL